MTEAILWMFVFVAWYRWLFRDKEQEMSGRWYLIYRYRWVGVDLIRYPRPIDGVYSSNSDAAMQVSAARNAYKAEERLIAVPCMTAEHRTWARELDSRHAFDDMNQTDFVDWMKQPAYSGNQDKHSNH